MHSLVNELTVKHCELLCVDICRKQCYNIKAVGRDNEKTPRMSDKTAGAARRDEVEKLSRKTEKSITKEMIKTKTLKKLLTNHIESDIIDKLLYGAVEITERKF